MTDKQLVNQDTASIAVDLKQMQAAAGARQQEFAQNMAAITVPQGSGVEIAPNSDPEILMGLALGLLTGAPMKSPATTMGTSFKSAAATVSKGIKGAVKNRVELAMELGKAHEDLRRPSAVVPKNFGPFHLSQPGKTPDGRKSETIGPMSYTDKRALAEKANEEMGALRDIAGAVKFLEAPTDSDLTQQIQRRLANPNEDLAIAAMQQGGDVPEAMRARLALGDDDALEVVTESPIARQNLNPLLKPLAPKPPSFSEHSH